MAVGSQVRESRRTHPEEWLSISLAVVGTIFAVWFVGQFHDWEPADNKGFWYAGAVWLGFAYVIIQLIFLLLSASQVRALGVLDSIISILPVIAGVVLVVEGALGNLRFSSYQMNMLAVVIVAGVSEFLLTIWIRFVINRRTFGLPGLSDG
jgi:hypothetical protein